MVFNMIGAGLSLLNLAAQAVAINLGFEATKNIVKKKLTPNTQSKKPQETPFDKKTAETLITNILNPDTEIKIEYSPELQNFLLKLGVHIKENQTILSPEHIKTLKSNIENIDTHLGNFGIAPQVSVGINDLANRFKNLGTGEEDTAEKKGEEDTAEKKGEATIDEKKGEANTDEKKQKYKNKRLANKVYNLLNQHDTDNYFDTTSYIEPHSLEGLLRPVIDATSEKPFVVSDKSVLTTILHAKVFPNNDDNEDDDSKRKITYQEFIDRIKLPDNVGISESDFKAFQTGTQEIPDLEKYKTTLKASDFDNEATLPTAVKVVFDNASLAGILTQQQKNNLIDYTKKNAKNIYINVHNIDNFLQAYKKIVTECDAETAINVNFKSSDKNVKSKTEILQNKFYGTLIGELLKAEKNNTITNILKKEKKDIDFNDIKTVIKHYKDSKINNVDNLFALIKDIAPDNFTHTAADTANDTETLIAQAILNHLNKSNHNKDDIFKAISSDTDKYTQIKTDYPDIMKKVFSKEMKNFDEAGKHISETALNGYFDILKKNDFSTIKSITPPTAQTYIYKKFLRSKHFETLDADNKLEFLVQSKTNLSNNSDIKILIQKEIAKINIDDLPENNAHKNEISASRNTPFNDAFDASYGQNSFSQYAKNFSVSELIFGNSLLAKGKKDRLKAYQDFIKVHQLNNVDTKNIDKPQDLVKLIMLHKLQSQANNLQEMTAKYNLFEGQRNASINRKINTMIKQLPNIDNKTSEINKQLTAYFGASVTIDNISPQQMKLLANWVDFEEKNKIKM